MSTEPDEKQSQPHSWFRIWAEVAGAWAISLAYPLYSNIASGPEALTAYGSRRLDVLVLILVVSLLGPLIIMLAELVVRRLFGEQPRRTVHGVVVGALLALVVWQWLLSKGASGIIRNILPLALAGLIAWLYVKTELVRNFALMFSIATVVVIGAFVTDYPIKEELLPHQALADTGRVESDTPVVIVVFDEFPLASLMKPDGSIDPRFRTFSTLSRKANWYPGMVGVADQTTFALPSIMTGQNPESQGGFQPTPPGRAGYANNLCSIAAAGGYEVHSYEPITDFCEQTWSLGTRVSATVRRAVGVDTPEYQDEIAPASIDRRVTGAVTGLFEQPWNEFDEDRAEAFDAFIEGLPDSVGSISFLHITFPHVFWIFSPDGTHYEDLRPSSDNMLNNPSTQGEIDRNAQQMMLQVEFTDRQLGRLVNRMKENGTWDESLFIVTADHGTAFQKSDSRRIINYNNSGWVVPVPLFIKYPGQQRGRVVKGSVNSRDIAPTVMSALGLEELEGQTGLDLTGKTALPDRRKIDFVGAIGGKTTLDLADVERRRKQATRYLDRLLGRSFYAPGGSPNLLGKSPDGLTEIPSEPSLPLLYENVDTRSDEIPAYFQAKLDLPEGSPYPGPLAISLNGRVAATTDPWRFGESWYTGVVLPTAGFRDGANEIRVYEIRPGD